MSYDVSLYRVEVKSRQRNYEGDDFFENPANLLAFTPEQKQALQTRLVNYGYVATKTEAEQTHYSHKKYKEISVLFTDFAVYFQSGFTEQGIFEISMTASEFTDTDEFAKYDPQNDGWEEF